MPRRVEAKQNHIPSGPTPLRVSDKNVLFVRYVFGENRVHAKLLKVGSHQEEFVEGINAQNEDNVKKFVRRFKLAAIQNHFDFVLDLPLNN